MKGTNNKLGFRMGMIFFFFFGEAEAPFKTRKVLRKENREEKRK